MNMANPNKVPAKKMERKYYYADSIGPTSTLIKNLNSDAIFRKYGEVTFQS